MVDMTPADEGGPVPTEPDLLAPPEGPFVDLAWASEEERAGSAGSRILFPLRTGVELFLDPTAPEAVARAKQAAVLYDELIFETGLYEVSVAADGSSDWWHPQETLTDERLAESRRLQTPGTPFSLAIGAEGSGRMTEIINSPLAVSYASEYHSGILDELAALDPGWVKVLTLGNKPPHGLPEGKLFRRLNLRDRMDAALMPESRGGDGWFKRNWIIKAFNRDLIVSSMVGAAFAPTSLFVPMIERRGIAPMRYGADTLCAIVPNLGAVPWEAVLEFREHPGSAEARAMLREFEEKAAREEPEDALAYMLGVQRNVSEALFSALEAKRTRWLTKIAQEALKTVVGIVPAVGQFAGGALTAAEMGVQWRRERNSWTAALMVLRRRA